MNVNLSDLNLKYSKGALRDINTGKVVTEKYALTTICEVKDVSFSEAKTIFNLIMEKIKENEEENAKLSYNIDDVVIQAADTTGFSKLFIKYYNSSTGRRTVFLDKKSGGLELIPHERKTSDLARFFEYHIADELAAFTKIIADVVTKGTEKSVGQIDCETYLSIYFRLRPLFGSHGEIVVDADPHPVVVEGCPALSFKVIPYKEINNNEISINPTMAELLSRMTEHEYFCAMFWMCLNGVAVPYLPYFYGKGGDGKSSFITVLGKIVKSIAAYSEGNQFSASFMYGKAIIAMAENTNPHILSNKLIKSITGGSTISIEGKGKAAIAATIRGLVIVDSNTLPYLKGEENELRRLRVFEFRKSDEEKISQDAYIEKLLDKSNDFINYCRMCFENFNIPLWGLLPTTPRMYKILSNCRNPRTTMKCEALVKKLTKAGFKFRKSFSASQKIVEHAILNFDKSEYILQEFKTYAEIEYGVTLDAVSGVYHGIGAEDEQTPI